MAAAGDGFRTSYWSYEALTAQLHAWAEQYPHYTRLRSLGQTPEGRQIWLLIVGAEAQARRPAVWVDANLHAAEVSGTSVALAIAEAALALHTGDAEPPVPAALRPTLEQVHFHICPRISPDGAERVLETGQFVRSVPRTELGDPTAPHWRRHDVDGDGAVRYLRIADPGGGFVESSEAPGVMLPRRPEDPPPYYRLYPEGTIANWDGDAIPEPDWLAGTTDRKRGGSQSRPSTDLGPRSAVSA